MEEETMSIPASELLLGLGIGSFSSIEGKIEAVLSQLPLLKPGPETHLLSCQEIRTKFEEMRADILTGWRGILATGSAVSAVNIEDDVLGDNVTEVDMWYEVHAWMEGVGLTASAEMQQRDVATNAWLQEQDDGSIIDIRCFERVKAPKVDANYYLNPLTNAWIPVSEVYAMTSKSTEADIACVVPLHVSLEEVYTGPTRRVALSRVLQVAGSDQTSFYEDLLLDVEVKKDVLDGYQVRYIGAGNQQKTYTEDLVFEFTHVSV